MVEVEFGGKREELRAEGGGKGESSWRECDLSWYKRLNNRKEGIMEKEIGLDWGKKTLSSEIQEGRVDLQ